MEAENFIYIYLAQWPSIGKLHELFNPDSVITISHFLVGQTKILLVTLNNCPLRVSHYFLGPLKFEKKQESYKKGRIRK